MTLAVKVALNPKTTICEDYDKVVYGLKHAVTLTRNDYNDAIFRKGPDALGAGAVDIGKIMLSKISWFMLHVTPADKDKIELNKIIERKEKLPVGYRMIQCDTASILKRFHLVGGFPLNHHPKYRVLS